MMGSVRHRDIPVVSLRRVILMCLALTLGAFGGPVYAQFAPPGGGCPPGTHPQGFSCVYDAPSGQPRPKESVNVHVAVAWHPDANDVWAIWNVRDSQGGDAAAKRAVLSDCQQIMGEGCTIANGGRNSSVAIGRSRRGFLSAAWGENAATAKKALADSCTAATPCTVLHVFTAKPWVEYSDVPGFDELKRYRPNPRSVKARFGAVATAEVNDPRWGHTAWVSSGHTNVDAAIKAAQDKCTKDIGTFCESYTAVSDGVMAVHWDESGNLRMRVGKNVDDARRSVRAACKRDGVKCDVVELIDAKQPGLTVLNPTTSPAK